MKAKQLPFKTPPIIGYQSYAFPLGIAANYNNYLPWLYSNYIQLKCASNFLERRDLWFDFLDGNVYGGIPFLEYDCYVKDDFSCSYDDLVDFIIESINRNSYIYTFVDLFYIPNTFGYQQSHFTHDILVLGYNLSENTLMIGHFDIKGSFSIFNISMIDFHRAFMSLECEQKFVILLKMKDENFICNLDIDHIKEMLTDYLLSNEPSSRLGMDFIFQNTYHSNEAFINMSTYYDEVITKMKPDRIYGLKVYDYLTQYIDCFSGNKELDFDIRPIHILWEHKKCMIMRLQYMYSNGYFTNKANSFFEIYRQIEQKALALRNTSIKYNITKNSQLLNRLKSSLEEIRIQEYDVIPSLINEIL
ncbi:MAG: hypothetical protein ABFD25_17785 [Clostridiaceae bacterium]